MSLPSVLQSLALPVIGAPMFIAGQIDNVIPAAEVVAQLAREYTAARQRLSLAS